MQLRSRAVTAKLPAGEPGTEVAPFRQHDGLDSATVDLHDTLQARGIENLLFCGTATNMCCESSARDAMMIGYRCVMVLDGNAARFDEDHIAGLTSFWQSFGDVRTTDDVIERLLVSPGASRAAE